MDTFSIVLSRGDAARYIMKLYNPKLYTYQLVFCLQSSKNIELCDDWHMYIVMQYYRVRFLGENFLLHNCAFFFMKAHVLLTNYSYIFCFLSEPSTVHRWCCCLSLCLKKLNNKNMISYLIFFFS